MLSFDEETVWGVRRARGNGENYTLFAKANEPPAADAPHLPDFRRSEGLDPISWQWTTPLTMRPRAILRAGNALVLGGMPAAPDEQDPFATFEGQEGGTLWTASTADGAKLGQRQLKSPPVWDGMAAAAGRLYVSTQDGSLLCLGTSP